MNALLPNRRLTRRVGVVNAVEEQREGVGAQGPGDGLELGDRDGERISVGELIEAGDDSLLEIVSRPGGGGSGLGWTQRVALGRK